MLPAWWADRQADHPGPEKQVWLHVKGFVLSIQKCFWLTKSTTYASRSTGGINLFILSDVLGLFWSSIVCASQLSHDAIFKQHPLGNAELGRVDWGPGLLKCASGLFYALLGDSSERSWWNSGGLLGRFAIVPNCLGVIGFVACCFLRYFYFFGSNID